MSRTSPAAAEAPIATRAFPSTSSALLLLGLSGCGFGTAVVASSSDGGGGTNAAPSMSAFLVTGPQTPPSEIHFRLSDAEGDPATVEFLYLAPGFAAEHMAHLPANPAQFPTSPQGVDYTLPWDFAAEDLLPDDASFMDGVLVYAIVHGAPNVIVLGANAEQLGLGNDAPVLTADDVPAEVSGVVPVPLHMSDSSSDVVDIRVEYDILSDAPDAGWQIARPAGLLAGTPTPPLAFEGLTADALGSDIVFFWDTDFDLHDLERDVQLRVTPIDPVVSGTPALTNLFRVDNNVAPILQFHEGEFLSNPDSVRGISVSFTVIDEESDEITVGLQWRREGESFPQLPNTPSEIEAILSDEDLRREYHVCSQYPRRFEGRPVQVDETHVRLPELSGDLSFLVQTGLAGRELEFLRPTKSLVPVSDGWTVNPVARPVAALPLRRGTHALVLDQSSSGSWKLVEVRLLDGVVESTVANGEGEPSTACFEGDETTVLVASSVGTIWQVERVVLASGATTHLADATNGPVEQGEVRGLASIATNAAVLTVGSSLVRVDWAANAAPRAVAVRTDLATPWGVVVDSRNAGRVLVAENSAPEPNAPGRIVSVELATRTLHPVVILPGAADGLAVPRPRGLALLRKGARLLAVCETDPLSGSVELRSVDLGRADTGSALSLGPLQGSGTAGLAAVDEDDLVLSTSGPDRRVHVAGGVERRAAIEDVDPGTATAALASAITPALAPDARWRIVLLDNGPFRVASSPQGLVQTFLWDSSDVPGGGNAFLRVTPLDADLGAVTSSTGPKPVSPTFGGEALVVTSGNGHRAVVQADLDADGDLDLVSVNVDSDDLQVFWQAAPGAFDPSPATLGGPATTPDPASVQAADLDGDGDLDLVSGNYGNGTLTVFWQTAPGAFDPTPSTLVLPGPIGGLPVEALVVQAADLDGDGDLDLVSANYGSDSLAVFWQTAPGLFDPTPAPVGGPSTSGGPVCVQAADLDGDGDLDLVSANWLTDDLTVFWGTGSGSFDPGPTVLSGPTVVDPSFVQATDLDGDGDLDLVSANAVSNTLTVFWQIAPGKFDTAPTTLGGTFETFQPAYVEAEDLDGDGDLDLVCVSSGAFLLAVFWQTAPGSFDPIPTTVGGPTTNFFPLWVQAADLDGDGDLDLVSASLGQSLPGGLAVFWQTAPGTFDPTPITLSGLGNEIRGPFFVEAADLDGDGDLDLVSANEVSDNLTVFWQTGPAAFDPTLTVVGGPSTTASARAVQAADLDGDGDLDLVSANFDSHTLTVFWQTAPGSFDPIPKILGTGITNFRPFSVRAADLDGDGDLDLVSGNYIIQTLTVFWQTAPGDFGPVPTSLGGPATTFQPSSVQAADLDLDGDLDLVSANLGSQTLTVFWQTAPGLFDPAPTTVGGPSTTLGARFVQAADLDGDGDLELVSANATGDNLTVFWQTATGLFDPSPTTLGGQATTDRPRSVQAADLDGDGDLDLVSANFDSQTLTVFWQTAPGRFDPAPISVGESASTNNPNSIEAIDIDGDGDLDLVSANWNASSLTIFRRLH